MLLQLLLLLAEVGPVWGASMQTQTLPLRAPTRRLTVLTTATFPNVSLGVKYAAALSWSSSDFNSACLLDVTCSAVQVPPCCMPLAWAPQAFCSQYVSQGDVVPALVVYNINDAFSSGVYSTAFLQTAAAATPAISSDTWVLHTAEVWFYCCFSFSFSVFVAPEPVQAAAWSLSHCKITRNCN